MKNRMKREEALIEQLQHRKRMSIAEIQKDFDVSQSTARRLCAALADQGRAIRTVGGIQVVPETAVLNYSYEVQATRSIAEKQAIGTYASTLVRDNSLIFISGGTTMQQFVLALTERIGRGELKNLTVMTNSLDHVMRMGSLQEGVRLILTGGEFLPKRLDVVGGICERAIREARFDQCFAGADGVDWREGMLLLDVGIAGPDQLAAQRADEVYILMDHSKFSATSYLSRRPMDEKYTLITDRGISPAVANRSEWGPWRLEVV